MQISRHWRLSSQRYRLQGIRYENGEVSLQARPICKDSDETCTEAENSRIARDRTALKVTR